MILRIAILVAARFAVAEDKPSPPAEASAVLKQVSPPEGNVCHPTAEPTATIAVLKKTTTYCPFSKSTISTPDSCRQGTR